MRTQLLVSVRSVVEYRTAVDAGVATVDIKEPKRGSLGRADLSLIGDIARASASDVTLSVAMGELIDADEALCESLPARIDFVKFGLSNCKDDADWKGKWRRVLDLRHQRTQAVAVAYADSHSAKSPPAEEVIETGAAFGCQAFLLDTFRKENGNLLEQMSLPEVADCVSKARQAGLLVALAGSLKAEAIRSILHLRPDLIAVRSAVCGGQRTSAINGSAVRRLVHSVATSFASRMTPN